VLIGDAVPGSSNEHETFIGCDVAVQIDLFVFVLLEFQFPYVVSTQLMKRA
jgi:hypothetical protein